VCRSWSATLRDPAARFPLVSRLTAPRWEPGLRAALAWAATALPGLTALDVSGCTALPEAQLAVLRLPRLQHLSAARCWALTGRALLPALDARALRALSLAETAFDWSQAAPAGCWAESCTSLTRLDLSATAASPRRGHAASGRTLLRALVAAAAGTLVELRLARNAALTDDALAGALDCELPALRLLDASACGELATIAAPLGMACPGLEDLDVSGTAVGAADFGLLASLCPRLRRLRLRGAMRVDDRSLAPFLLCRWSALHGGSLVDLSLADLPRVTAPAMAALLRAWCAVAAARTDHGSGGPPPQLRLDVSYSSGFTEAAAVAMLQASAGAGIAGGSSDGSDGDGEAEAGGGAGLRRSWGEQMEAVASAMGRLLLAPREGEQSSSSCGGDGRRSGLFASLAVAGCGNLSAAGLRALGDLVAGGGLLEFDASHAEALRTAAAPLPPLLLGPSLTALDLSGCGAVDDGAAAAIAAACSSLERLALIGCRGVGERGLRALAAGCARLADLAVGGGGWREDAALSGFTRLTALSVSRRPRTALDHQLASALAAMPRLARLALAAHPLGDAALLGAHAGALTELRLTCCAGVEGASLGRLRNLRVLSLDGCPNVSPAAVISAALAMTRLTALHLPSHVPPHALPRQALGGGHLPGLRVVCASAAL